MKTLAGIIAAVVLSAAACFAVVSKAGPDTADLDQDIASLAVRIDEAKSEAAHYTGGLMALEVELRTAILQNTVAMLEQKRASYLRGISLTYTDPILRVTSGADNNSVEELAKARAEAASAKAEAARYSGGLIQTMALLREATAKVTEVSVEQRLALTKAGIPMPLLSTRPRPPAPIPEKTVGDKDAL